MELDEESGARLRALGEHSRRELDPAAQARIAAALAQQGPGVVRRARRVRRAWQVAAGACALGLAWSAARLAAPAGSELASDAPRPNTVASSSAATAKTPSVEPAAPAASATARACEQRAVQEPRFLHDEHEHGERIALGELGTAVVDPGAALWLDARDPCRVRLRLLEGKVLVHAADLGGGELRVATERGDVVVHGTKFSVAHSRAGLTVEVAEGRVAVVRHARPLVAALEGGQRARIGEGEAPRVEPLSARERDALLARLAQPLVDAAPAQPPASPATIVSARGAREAAPGRSAGGHGAPEHVSKRSAGELVQEADALWRDGQLEHARARYREAGALAGPTAEAAWLALARRELSAGRTDAAESALRDYAARFPSGALAAEAEGIGLRVMLQRGDEAGARKRAERLAKRYPHTPQADAAERWLREHPLP